MLEIFKLIGTVAINGTDEAKKDVNKVTQEAASAGNKLADNLGKITLSVAKFGAAAIGTVATGMGILLKSAVANYAEYEQLVGGVETLFKNSSKKVMKYANDAYKNAGLSANQYMETVTGFSAALLQSLEGDTERAADIANMAINDMSDNANKMGTSMESIQTAYQGFAKQNYTMLDNLKLGYGGTKEEMERLLEDAEKLKAAQGELVDYSIDSYADIIDAIHTVQVEMGIYGTTSKEASTTIQGSLGMMKSAWRNFITGMADDSQNFDTLLNNFIDSVITFMDNLIPRIVETLPRLIKGLTQLTKKLAPYIPKLMKELIPSLVEGAKAILKVVVDDLPSILESLMGKTGRKLGEVISKIFSEIVPAITEFAEDILPLIVNAVEFLADNFREIVSVIGIVVAAFETMSIINTVTTAVNGASSAFGALSAVMSAHPIGMVVAAVGGLAVGISALTSLFSDNTEEVSENVRAAREVADAAREESQAFRDMKAAAEEKAAAELSNISNTERLWGELQKLTDESGNVAEADRARAEFIIGELNEALGTEIEMVDGQIQGYEELQDAIANTIAMKKAEILLQANEEEYTEAVKNCNEQQTKAAKAKQEYLEAQSKANQLRLERDALREQDAANMFDGSMHERVVAAEKAYNEQAQIAATLHSAYDESAGKFADYCSTIETYESASVAMQQGNAEEVMDILDSKGKAYLKAADIAGEATEQEKQQFLEQAQQMSAEYAFLADEYLKGTEGITEEMVQQAGEMAELAWSEYQKVGGKMNESIISGVMSGSDSVNAALKAIVTNGLNAAQSAANSYSPSTSNYVPKTGGAGTQSGANFYNNYYGGRKHAKGGIVKKGEIAFLEGEGTEAVVPLEKNTEWIGKVADNMTSAINARQSGDGVATSALLAKFDELINAITQQRIYLDSDVLVGELTPALDTSLGDVYAGKARGR